MSFIIINTNKLKNGLLEYFNINANSDEDSILKSFSSSVFNNTAGDYASSSTDFTEWNQNDIENLVNKIKEIGSPLMNEKSEKNERYPFLQFDLDATKEEIDKRVEGILSGRLSISNLCFGLIHKRTGIPLHLIDDPETTKQFYHIMVEKELQEWEREYDQKVINYGNS